MSTLSTLAADLKAESESANVRSLACVVGEPQRAEPLDEESQDPEKTETNLPTITETDATTQNITAFQTWQTRVKIFLLSTGGDTGSHAEIRVWAGIEGYPIAYASTGLPLHTSWANENGGFGRQLAHQVRSRVGAIPRSFGGYVDENDTIGSNGILFLNIDFTKPEWIGYADGNAHYLMSRNSKDAGYVAYLWWQVTKI